MLKATTTRSCALTRENAADASLLGHVWCIKVLRTLGFSGRLRRARCGNLPALALLQRLLGEAGSDSAASRRRRQLLSRTDGPFPGLKAGFSL